MIISGVLVFIQLFALSTAIGVSGKLDFGDSHQSSLYRSANQKISTPLKYTKTIKIEEASKDEDFDNLGVVCSSSGCNTTKTDQNNSDTIETDVVVHVQTKVPVKNDSKKVEEDIPDVPVVLGYSGSALDSTRDDEASRPTLTTPKSIIIPSNFDILDSPLRSPSFDSFIDIQPPISYSQRKSSSFAPVTVTMSEDGRKIGGDGFQLQVPYHGHYFGEEPPPQFVWYPNTRKQVHNPVEFKSVYSTNWKPSLWNARNIPHGHYGSNTVCECNNRRVDSVGSPWQANRRTFGNNYNSRGTGTGVRIDDKLAPPFHENH